MYYCGWDGGGTKTEVCILEENGQERTSAVFGPLNVNGASRTAVEQTVQSCVAFMDSQRGECGGLVVGMAGVSNERALGLMRDMLSRAGYAGPLSIVGDQEIALAGAVSGHGAVLIAGTGAILFGRDKEGNRFRVGGYGYLIDDLGSGYAIGRDILAAVVRAADGRDGDTLLTSLVLAQLNARDVGGVITWLYSPETGKKEVASLARLLAPALDKGDAAALRIAMKAAQDLAELVTTGWRKTAMTDGELALAGSILSYYPMIREKMEALVRASLPDVRIHAPTFSPARGAAMLAAASFRGKD